MDINQLRQYRFQLNQPFVNSKGQGIAIFDFSMTFLIAYIIEPYIREYLKLTRPAYYLMLLPLGVVIHLLTKQETFLNKQLFNNSINLYKVIMIVILYKLYQEFT
jgi:hypothetical protein